MSRYMSLCWIDNSFVFRLVAQIHDELLFEVEFAQVNEFAGEGVLL